MIPLLLDEGLPRGAAQALRERGWDAVHVWDLGMQGASDEDLLERAAREGRVVVTLDSDFPRLLALERLPTPSVVFLRLQGLGTSRAVQLLTSMLPELVPALKAGAVAVHDGARVRVRTLPIQGDEK